MTPVDRRNERAREDARAARQATYRHQVVEDWPGCTDCGQPIKGWDVHRGWDVYRRCGCGGRQWWCGPYGWVVVTPGVQA